MHLLIISWYQLVVLTSTLHKFLIFYFLIIMLLFAAHRENPKDPCAQHGWHSW